MVIKISGLADGINEFSFAGTVNELKLGTPFIGKYTMFITLDKSHSQLVATVTMKITASFECDRCSKDFITEIASDFRHVYLFGVEPIDSESVDEVSYLPFETDKIDLSKEIFDYAYLNIPMKKLCNENCKGYCPVCLTDLNEGVCQCKNETTDSRWDTLKNIKLED